MTQKIKYADTIILQMPSPKNLTTQIFTSHSSITPKYNALNAKNLFPTVSSVKKIHSLPVLSALQATTSIYKTTPVNPHAKNPQFHTTKSVSQILFITASFPLLLNNFI
jgi:SMC interacting uncharacterized protein involved in chromosome segregation